jgi:hypothetical protein
MNWQLIDGPCAYVESTMGKGSFSFVSHPLSGTRWSIKKYYAYVVPWVVCHPTFLKCRPVEGAVYS